MKITIINFTTFLYSLSLPNIVQILRKAGHDVRCVNVLSDPKESLVPDLPAIIEIANGSDVVGLSLFSCYHNHAVVLTKALKRQIGDIPVIWGGVHTTYLPELSLQFADYICVGEGEEAFPEFIESLSNGKKNPVNNIWYMSGDKIVKTAMNALNSNMDAYPPFDYNHEGFYRVEKGKARHLKDNEDAVKAYYGKDFFIITSRGCIFKCTYCSNDSKNKLYGDNYRGVRRFSNERVLQDLETAKKHLPFIESVSFIDDDFISRKAEELADFCQGYKKRIGLPFFSFGNPVNINQQNIDMLVDAGMHRMQIGVQTGSPRMQKLYRRPVTNAKVIAVSNFFERHKGKIVPTYDFILDNPWETDEDKEDSLNLIMQIKEPKRFDFFSLTFFPGTSLQKRALDEGIISTEGMLSSHASIIKNSFYNSLMLLAGHFKMADKSIERLKRWKNNKVAYWLLSRSTQVLLSLFFLNGAFKGKNGAHEVFRYFKIYTRYLYDNAFKKKKKEPCYD